jgi:A/G-specific adenine glycosylase
MPKLEFDTLIKWSKENYAHLPWRKKRTLYKTLVSEIMLQQTTVQTVTNKFEDFLETFPTIQDLAMASESEMLIAWKGLGYYRRARNLKNAAITIVEQYDGKVPKKLDQLLAIPGIGDYTANALLSIGMNRPALAVDANLERVLARIYGISTEKGPKLQLEIRQRFEAGKLLKDFKGSFRDLNEAFMDLGRTYCQLRRTSCELCVFKRKCVALKNKDVLAYPVVKDKVKLEREELSLYRFIIKKGDKILAYKKVKGEWLEGQYEIPTLIMSSSDKKLKQYSRSVKKYESYTSYKTSITKYKIVNHIVYLDKKIEFPFKTVWVDSDFAELSTASIKALKKN